MSQFSFLQAEFADVHALAAQAETVAHSDPRAACVYARLALETVVNWLYRHDGTLKLPYERTLAARIYEATFRAAHRTNRGPCRASASPAGPVQQERDPP